MPVPSPSSPPPVGPAPRPAVDPSAADARPAPGDTAPALSAQELAILALEGRTFRYVGAKERAIREEIGISKVAYYVRLNALLDDPRALRAAPALVHRLRGRRVSEHGEIPRRGGDRVA